MNNSLTDYKHGDKVVLFQNLADGNNGKKNSKRYDVGLGIVIEIKEVNDKIIYLINKTDNYRWGKYEPCLSQEQLKIREINLQKY